MLTQISHAKRLVCTLLATTAISGCSIFLPPHSHSDYRENEEVSIEMIETCTELDTEVASLFGAKPPVDVYDKVFHESCGGSEAQREFVPAAAAAAAIVGFAIDYVQEQLKKEATLYEAQWEQRIARDDFWTAPKKDEDHRTMKYVGFKVTRTVEDKPASRAIFAFRGSGDGHFLLVAPIAYKLDKAKAKVLSDEWYTTYTPWLLLTFPGKFARIAGHSVDTDVAVEMTAFWIDGKAAKTEAIAAFTVPIKGYDIGDSPVLYPGKGLPTTPVGWVASVPTSSDANTGTKMGRASGNFTVKVLATEKDTSNAQRLLLQAADKIGQQKPTIQQFVIEKVGGSGTTP